jgi:amino acid transporter
VSTPPPNLEAPRESLKRSLRLVDVVAIGLNGVIGTGIFLLPGNLAAAMGPAALVAYLISALLCTLVVLCFAEVGSRFRGTGGPMLYSRAAFGELPGFIVGWFTWLTRITAWGALANGMVTAAAALLPAAQEYRVLILTVLIATLAVTNIAGVSVGARVTNFFTAAKMLPIAFFIAIGVFHIKGDLFTPFAPLGLSALAPTTLVALWAFVGFEVLTVPAGEMRHPRRSVPRALILTMSVVTVVYLLIWAVCTGTLATLAGSENPVADAAMEFMGPRGGGLIAFGILLSVLGINAGNALVAPRCLYALAHEGFLPRQVAWVHPTRRTPVVAIVVTSAVALVLAISGSYVELAVVSVVARFVQYIPTCIAVLYFRKRRPGEEPGFRIPWGPAVPVLAVGLCAWLLIASEWSRLLWGLVGLAAGLSIYALMRLLRGRAAGSGP